MDHVSLSCCWKANKNMACLVVFMGETESSWPRGHCPTWSCLKLLFLHGHHQNGMTANVYFPMWYSFAQLLAMFFYRLTTCPQIIGIKSLVAVSTKKITERSQGCCCAVGPTVPCRCKTFVLFCYMEWKTVLGRKIEALVPNVCQSFASVLFAENQFCNHVDFSWNN